MMRIILFYLYFLPFFSLAETPVLTIYAPDYFVSEWGPGPKIEQEFEKKCNCDLKFIPGEPLSRVMLEGKSTNADILLGVASNVQFLLVCLVNLPPRTSH